MIVKPPSFPCGTHLKVQSQDCMIYQTSQFIPAPNVSAYVGIRPYLDKASELISNSLQATLAITCYPPKNKAL
ncbi:hypothetical protein Pcar_3305 [Syntrophotalea carbinolica DSM 2380]|uniref:Uncharacterized protein n=1 Tax=Syntrophotalea carbinolica (strain DSM 2380 / NBRC 103641 / GraBd1) TaxID=338963 RepID=Q0C6L3_SYNC1|nr:hypothetical protein Pcar_3305 [Syntrophotalea carbinolica DSM 2380]